MKQLLSILCTLSVFCVFLIGCTNYEPEYMHPYGEGVDPDTVTTVPFQSRTTTLPTTVTTTSATKKTLTTVPHGAMEVSIPEGHKICPLCQGVLVICETCLGTMKVKVEEQDPSTGVFIRVYADCPDCLKSPGYSLCEVCENVLYIKE